MENGVREKLSASEFEDGFVRALAGLLPQASEADVPL
jgi:hypothetical protein